MSNIKTNGNAFDMKTGKSFNTRYIYEGRNLIDGHEWVPVFDSRGIYLGFKYCLGSLYNDDYCEQCFEPK